MTSFSKSTSWDDAPGGKFPALASASAPQGGFFKAGAATLGSTPMKKSGNLRPLNDSASAGNLSVFEQQAYKTKESQASTMGRASSTGALVKLPPLPKIPLTFDNLYSMAKKRASKKAAVTRQATVQSQPSSPSQKFRSLPAVVLDTEDTEEEIEWASDTLGYVPGTEEYDDFVESRRNSKVPIPDLEGLSRASSKRQSTKDNGRSASHHMAQQMSTMAEEEQPGIEKRDTRALAAEHSTAYIQALRQLMEGDEGFHALDTMNNSVALSVAGQSGALEQRLKVSVNGFTEEELKRMRTAFARFKGVEGNEIHKDDLPQALRFLAYMKVDEKVCHQFANETCTYAMLDWQEYLDFVERFATYELEEFRKEFELMDIDGSGQLSMTELKALISFLGVTPFKETLDEAMAVVDFDSSGALDFDEFVHLMAVYRVTEGFTREEVKNLRGLFDRVAINVIGGPKEVKPDRLGDIMVAWFGPQSITLASKLARRFANGDHSDPAADTKFANQLNRQSCTSQSPMSPTPTSPKFKSENEDTEEDTTHLEPGLPFPEFLLWARRLREAEIQEFRKQFKRADVDQSGSLGKVEIRQVITAVGYMPLRTIVEEVLEQVDTDHNANLDFDEFVNLMAVFRKSDGFCKKEIKDLTDVFNNFKDDADDDDGDDTVNCMELMEVLRSMGYVTNLDVVRRFIKQVDFDNSNTLNLPEFIRLMRMHREVELNAAFEAFRDEILDTGRADMDAAQCKRALRVLDYNPTEEMLEQAMVGINDSQIDFDAFVTIVDLCRHALQAIRRMMAGYSDEDIKKYQKAFEVYDEDSSGDIEKDELTSLLKDLGIPLGTKNEQKAMLDKLDIARENARAAGCDEDLLGNMGDPSVTFSVLLFLLRMMATAADNREVDRDREIMEKTNFSPKETEEFREIFTYWSVKASALDAGHEAPESHVGSPTGDNAIEDLARNQVLTPEGVKRVVRSLGLTMTAQDRKDLDDKLDQGPTDPNNPGKYGFFEFLLFMRWMLDSNFCHIHDVVAVAAVAVEDA